MNHKTNDTPPETSPNALYSRRGVAIIAAGAALTLAVPAISFAAPTSDEVRRQRDLGLITIHGVVGPDLHTS